MGKEFYKGRICYDCTFFYPEGRGWQNKCLHCRGFTMLSYIRDIVLPENICEKYRKEIMNEMNDYSNPATPLMSEKKCENCRHTDKTCSQKWKKYPCKNWLKPKCPTCGDSGVVNEENPRTTQLEKVPCPGCTKPEINTAMDWNDFEQIEGISEVMSKSVAKRLAVQKPDEDKISLIRMEGAVHRFDMLQDKDRLYKEGHHDGYKSAISDHEKEIEELKNAIDLMIEDRDSFHNNNLKLKDLLDKVVEGFNTFIEWHLSCRVFITSRERVKKPEGENMDIEKVKEAYEALKEIQEGRK